MTHPVSLSAATFTRLQALAVPLVDTIETVINRALDALEATSAEPAKAPNMGAELFNPAGPPSLSYTTVKSAMLEGKRLPPAETYWNTLMYACIRAAAAKGKTAQEIVELLLVPSVVGKKEEGGFRFIEDAGLSVQGQDANAAWRAIHRLATAIGLSVEVTFMWQQNPKAASPGKLGAFTL